MNLQDKISQLHKIDFNQEVITPLIKYLTLEIQPQKGHGIYSDLFWWRMPLNEPIEEYTHIHFMPYAITDEFDWTQSDNTIRPNIDKETGNIRPINLLSWKEWCEAQEHDFKIRQLVLVNNKNHSYGPKSQVDLYKYYLLGEHNESRAKQPVIPKACFYPLINPKDEKEVKHNIKYQTLKEIANALIKLNLMDTTPIPGGFTPPVEPQE